MPSNTMKWYWALIVMGLLHLSLAQDCVFREGDIIYDLTPLRRDRAYEATGEDGNNFYFFNFCGEVSQGACTPHQSVCQVGDAPHGCGAATEYKIEKMTDKEGVKLTYTGGERCQVINGPRDTVISVACNHSVEGIEVTNAGETSPCHYYINLVSKYGCSRPAKQPAEPPSHPLVDIFVVVHSHDDVGWLSTINQYYDTKVQSILTNVKDALLENPERKFIQVEMAFFEMWWQTLNTAGREEVRKLVKERRLSFAIGGWVMPDEAGPTYSSLISQLTEGHQLIKREFGDYTPDVGWQIDPFGASTVMAEIYKRSNFKGHVIDRIDFRLKNELQTNKSLQFSWKLSNNSDDEILTHILDTNYCYPFMSGFSIKYALSPDEVKRYADYLVDIARNKAKWARTPNVLIPLGCDFAYYENGHAKSQFKAMDDIFAYIREHKVEYNVSSVQYSNVSDYFDALSKSNASFYQHTGDFMPYNDKDNSYWTGYYTSRSELKGLIRTSEAVLRTSESLYTAAKVHANYANTGGLDSVTKLSHAVAVNLHHDAITGTATTPVVDDYFKILNGAVPENENLIGNLMTSISNTTANKKHSISYTNTVSVKELKADTSENERVIPLTIYNSLGWSRIDYVRVVLTDYDPTLTYVVTLLNQTTRSQVITKFEGTDQTVIYFKAVLPPMGYQTYFIRVSGPKGAPAKDEEVDKDLESLYLKISFSGNNTIAYVTPKDSPTIKFEQNFMMYDSFVAPPQSSTQNSGAYIFRPAGDSYFLDKSTNFASATWKPSAYGDLLYEMYQVFDAEKGKEPFVKQSVRIFNDNDEFSGNFLELAMTVGEIPKNSEIVTRFMTSLATNGESYTDSNGFRFLKRKWREGLFEPIAGNYYPSVYASYILDNQSAIGFIFDRQHGFMSKEGSAEVMIHRRCIQDDARGLGGSHLDDSTTIKPVIRVVFSTPKNILKMIYRHMYLMNFPPVVTMGAPASRADFHLSPLSSSPLSSSPFASPPPFSFLQGSLPESIHLADLKPMDTHNTFLLRLAHLFDVGEHPTLSEPVSIPVHSLFASPYCISTLNETSLTANSVVEVHYINQENYVLKLKPKQIKTYLATIERDQDYCSQGVCQNGMCKKLRCGFVCECDFPFNYDPVTQSCKSLESEVPPNSDMTFNQMIPLIIIAYLTSICTYNVHSELKKVYCSPSSPSSSSKKKRYQPKGKVKGFLKSNILLLESTFFPNNLRRHNE